MNKFNDNNRNCPVRIMQIYLRFLNRCNLVLKSVLNENFLLLLVRCKAPSIHKENALTSLKLNLIKHRDHVFLEVISRKADSNLSIQRGACVPLHANNLVALITFNYWYCQLKSSVQNRCALDTIGIVAIRVREVEYVTQSRCERTKETDLACQLLSAGLVQLWIDE